MFVYKDKKNVTTQAFSISGPVAEVMKLKDSFLSSMHKNRGKAQATI